MKAFVLTVFSILLLSLAIGSSAMAAVDRINITTVGVGNPPVYAIPNDGIDDKPQIDAAILAGKSIYFPPGTFNYNGRMTLPADSYRLYGEGPGVSTIIFTGNPAGIYAPSAGAKTLNVEGLTLQADAFNCGTAIYADFSEVGASPKSRTATIHNVQINGDADRNPGTGGYWTRGIYLNRAQNAVLDKVEINGNHNSVETGGPPTQFGIVWESPNSHQTTGLQASNLQIKFVNTALQTNGWVEGVFVQGFQFTFCGQNDMPVIDLNSFDAVNPKPGFHLVNGHVHTFQHGIRLTNLRAVKLSKVFILHHPTPDHGFSGNDVAFNNCRDGIVSRCTFIGVESEIPDETGIRLNNSHFMRLEGNYFTRMFPENKNASCIAIELTSAVRSASSITCSNSRGRRGAASETDIAMMHPLAIPTIGATINEPR